MSNILAVTKCFLSEQKWDPILKSGTKKWAKFNWLKTSFELDYSFESDFSNTYLVAIKLPIRYATWNIGCPDDNL